MSIRLEWIGEEFPRQGALAAEGFSRLLGRPKLDPLTVLVRETAQNSWDARLPRASVHYAIDYVRLDDRQRAALSEGVFDELPPRGLPLGASLARDDLAVLVISDRHTKGLGGPTRADRPFDGPTDYVDLLMNVGVGGHDFGGGTYGFGKTISYVVSRAGTIIVHSRTSNGLPRTETRLIGSAIGDRFDHGRTRYTGRHWWGRDKQGAPEPLTGRAADKLARALGFPEFEDEATGTSIMVIDPDFGDRSPSEAARFLAEAITWNLWPKMVKTHGRQPMHFSLSWEGEPVAIPHPADLPPLHGFVEALEALRTHDEPFRRADGLELVEIRSQRPVRRLGRLALHTFVTRPRPLVLRATGPDPDRDPLDAAAFEGNAHHVALLRVPELVVSYLPGQELPDAAVEWAGVFICDRDLDAAFAAAEPPTHDDWQPALVSDRQERSAVNVALREIKQLIRNRALAAAGEADPGSASVARIADALAGLVGGVVGTGPGRSSGTAPSRGTPTRRRPTIGAPVCGPVLVDGARVARLSFTLDNPSSTDVRLTVRAGVATNDGAAIESDPPVGSPVPVLVRIEGPVPVEGVGVPEVELVVPATPTTEWTVLATSPDDVMVAFDVDASPWEAASA